MTREVARPVTCLPEYKVSDLAFPIWVVSQRRGQAAGPVTVGTPDTMAAFSSPDGAAAYMVALGDDLFELHLVTRDAFLPLADDWLGAGVAFLSLDPGRPHPVVLDLAVVVARLTWPV